jgi:hypothetical protein
LAPGYQGAFHGGIIVSDTAVTKRQDTAVGGMGVGAVFYP